MPWVSAYGESSIQLSTWSLSDEDPRETTSSSFSTLLLLRGRGSTEEVAAAAESAISNILMTCIEGRTPSFLVRLKALLNVGYTNRGSWMTGETRAPKSRGKGT